MIKKLKLLLLFFCSNLYNLEIEYLKKQTQEKKEYTEVLLKKDKEIIGGLTYSEIQPGVFYLKDLYIEPKYRNLGYKNILSIHVLQNIIKQNPKKIYIIPLAYEKHVELTPMQINVLTSILENSYKKIGYEKQKNGTMVLNIPKFQKFASQIKSKL